MRCNACVEHIMRKRDYHKLRRGKEFVKMVNRSELLGKKGHAMCCCYLLAWLPGCLTMTNTCSRLPSASSQEGHVYLLCSTLLCCSFCRFAFTFLSSHSFSSPRLIILYQFLSPFSYHFIIIASPPSLPYCHWPNLSNVEQPHLRDTGLFINETYQTDDWNNSNTQARNLRERERTLSKMTKNNIVILQNLKAWDTFLFLLQFLLFV